MLRTVLGAVLVLGLLAGFASAETETDAVVVKYENNTLVVKVGDKEKTSKFEKPPHVHDTAGKDVKPADVGKFLVKDAKIEIVEEDGKVDEINVKK